ncbi:MAG: DUF4968 domain-containing protein [Desertifilum sp. SIO1I2]|nr:DUF4968 domain-containing protein [Desertifilum sp. SIO1I2]
MPQYFGQLQTLEQPWSTLGDVQSVRQDSRYIRFECNGPILVLSILADNLIRVRVSPTGTLKPRKSYAVTQPDEQWSAVDYQLNETEEAVEITTSTMRVRVQRHPCRVQCFTLEGQPFAQDTPIAPNPHEEFPSPNHNPQASVGWRLNSIATWKHIEADEHFYGFGERTGLLDKRSEIKTNWTVDCLDYGNLTDNMYQAIPFFMALRPQVGYGLFFNTSFWSQFDLGVSQPSVLRLETHTDELDYYLIYGPEPAQILQTYTQLTGRMPLPPKWALGYHQCRWSYESEDIVRKLAQEFRDRQIPCDVIHLDIDYMRGYRVFTWSPKRFPNPKQLLGDLAEDGFKVVTIIDPGVKYEPEGDYSVFDEGVQRDYFVRKADGQLFHGYVWPDKAVFPDFLRGEVRDWWAQQHKDLTEIGVAGIWNDMNEPAIALRPFGDSHEKIDFPLDSPVGEPGEGMTHAEGHNLYGLMMAKTALQGLKQGRSQERSFVLTRSGFAGIQRYSAVWTGDNQSLWDHLEMSMPMLCNLGLSGLAFVGADIGGFAGNATAEMFARWMQLGMLYPMMRAHSALSTAQHEPWVFGEEVEQICREYLNLRYQLLPYIYTLCWEASTTGAPILRPLLYHFPNDSHTYTLHDQVMLGPWLMAAPVYHPGVEYRAVYLPDGEWYDWHSGESYQGPTHILAHAPIDRMPLYVRAGAIIPMAPVAQSVDKQPSDTLTLRVWPGEGEWTMYEDDGHSFEYQQGAYSTTTYRVSREGEKVRFEVSARQGEWKPPQREVVVEVVGVGEQRFSDDGSDRAIVA